MGPCADKQVICTIIAPDGERWRGTNEVLAPQSVCPRKKGEDYEKCVSVCGQPGHAEIMALKAAGVKARGATAYIEGIGKICGDCLRAMAYAGIERVIMGRAP